jgi:hypothetical protein
MEKQALSYASNEKTLEGFLGKMSEFDLAHLKDAFKTYLGNHPNAIKGLEKRIKEREKSSLKIIPNSSNVGEKLNDSSVSSSDMKKSLSQQSSGSTVIVSQNTTNSQQRNVIVNPERKEELNPTMRH